jgi:hypothetical protein
MRHVLNPLHVYCSLSRLLRRRSALFTARVYERFFYTTIL